MRIVSGRCEGFPCVPDAYEPYSARFTAPFPQNMMTAVSGVNDGFPYISALDEVQEETFSNLCFADADISGLYYGDTEVSFAYCNGGTMFRKY